MSIEVEKEELNVTNLHFKEDIIRLVEEYKPESTKHTGICTIILTYLYLLTINQCSNSHVDCR